MLPKLVGAVSDGSLDASSLGALSNALGGAGGGKEGGEGGGLSLDPGTLMSLAAKAGMLL